VLFTELGQSLLHSGTFLQGFPSPGLQRALIPGLPEITLSLRVRITPHL